MDLFTSIHVPDLHRTYTSHVSSCYQSEVRHIKYISNIYHGFIRVYAYIEHVSHMYETYITLISNMYE